MKMKDVPIGERPREKALRHGIQTLSDAEVIAVLIGNGSRKDSALELAYKILVIFQDVKRLSLVHPAELMQISGIKEGKALRLLAAFEWTRRRLLPDESQMLFSDEAMIRHIYGQMIFRQREGCFVILLDRQSRVLQEQFLFQGSVSAVTISSSDILRFALKGNAKRLVLAHNHPSERVQPSQEDKAMTSALVLLASSLDIELVEHFVFTTKEAFAILQNCAFTIDVSDGKTCSLDIKRVATA